jgi:hypothetical protein
VADQISLSLFSRKEISVENQSLELPESYPFPNKGIRLPSICLLERIDVLLLMEMGLKGSVSSIPCTWGYEEKFSVLRNEFISALVDGI